MLVPIRRRTWLADCSTGPCKVRRFGFWFFLTLVACRPHRCFLALSSPRLSRQSLDDSPDQALLAKLGKRPSQTRASRQDSVKNADLRISSDFRGNPRYRASIAPPRGAQLATSPSIYLLSAPQSPRMFTLPSWAAVVILSYQPHGPGP